MGRGPEPLLDAELQHGQLLHRALHEAARTRLQDASRPLAIVDLSLVFNGPAEGPLLARGLVTGGGRSVCFCEAELFDGAQRLVARAMGTFRYQPSGAVPA